MRKIVRKNYRFSQEDVDNLHYIRLYLGLTEVEVIRMLLREARKELESESGAINLSPSPRERSAAYSIERHFSALGDAEELPL